MSAKGDFSGAATAVSHGDPIAPVIFGVTLILVAALIGRHLARRTDQPSVLGELLMGLMLGNVLAWSGYELMLLLREGTAVMDMTEAFLDLQVILLASGLIVAAVIGKLVSGLGVLHRGLQRTAVGVGKLPRGEVGLIFASIGRRLGVTSTEVLSAIVPLVIVTTFATPPMLKALFKDKGELTEAQSSPVQ